MRAGRNQAPTLAYAGLAALFVLTAITFGQRSYDTLDLMRHERDYVRPPFYLGDANWGVTFVQPEAEAAGMKYADTLISVNSRRMDTFTVYYGSLRQMAPGDRLSVQVQSPGSNNPVRNLSIELRPYRGSSDPDPGVSDYAAAILIAVALPAACVALGFWVAGVRIRDRSAWLLLVLLLSLPASFSGGPLEGLFGRSGIVQSVVVAFGVFFTHAAPPALMLFGIAFPERLPFDRRFPWLKWIVVGYLVLVAAFAAFGVALWLHDLDLARRLSSRPLQLLTGVEGDFGGAVSMLALVVCGGSLAWKAMTASSRDARRRLLLLFLGAGPGVAALLVVLAAGRLEYILPPWSFLPLIAMMLAFPLTMAYVILVHRAMDVRVVVRQGLQYVLARGGIRAVQIVLLVAVSVAATSLLAGGAGPARVAVVVAGMVAVVAIAGRFADRLRRWVDRRFFREAYEADLILSDLASKVRTIVETRPLLETVAAQISRSLHVQRIAILLEQGGTFQPVYALGYGTAPTVTLPADGAAVKRLRHQRHAVVRLDDADSWAHSTTGDERRTLEMLRPDLLLPLSLNERVLGIMSLGPKQSEEPFSTTDLRLLDSVAAQTGLALENGRLTAAIAAETAARAKQTRDIEIAREVQQRLFPQDYPPMPGLDYAGACRAALGVGGDYYDFILLSKTQLGIAIGDVSGKGIPASLLMASLRAYLRGAQTIHHHDDLTEVMRHLNALVYESSDANRYATFFYGELDLTSRRLTYVNAGHNPPMVFRNGGRNDVLRLETGGPVVGLMEDCVYRQDSVTLCAGDVLVAYTDGVSEAMNAADEEWGEERLMDAVRSDRCGSALGLIERLMTAADRFVAGAPQHDDMTLLVVRATFD